MHIRIVPIMLLKLFIMLWSNALYSLVPISDPYLPSSGLHGPHYLSHDFIWSANLALEKQTS